MNAPSFTSKQEYLNWVAEWKAEYKKLSQSIRDLKWANKEIQRAISRAALDKMPSYDPKVMDYLTPEHRERYLKIKAEHRNIWPRALREEATKMLEWRKQSKVEAQRQYLAQKGAPTQNCPGAPSVPA